jgi:hypothetical protein
VLLREFRRMFERTVDALATLCRRRLAASDATAGSGGTEAAGGEVPFAVLATGGNAREEGYLADYDVIFICEETPSAVDLCHRVAVLFNIEMTRLGVLPHHLFAEHFSRYAVPLGDLLGFLRKNRGRDFVERSEILGSRLVHGSSSLHRRFLREVVHEEVLEHRVSYLRAMLEDEEARRRETPPGDGAGMRLKSDPGGLKEIHLTLDLLRARFSLIEAIPRRLFPKLVALDPGRQEEYFTLLRTLNFLLRLRVMYQLTVGHESTIDAAQMQHALIALRLGGSAPAEMEAALLERYRVRTARAAAASVRIIAWLRAELALVPPGEGMDSASSSSILGVGPGNG